MRTIRRVLVYQTAFIGDVILTLPLIQQIREFLGDVEIDVVVVPRAADVCRNHPAIDSIIEYDKRGRDRGWKGVLRLAAQLRERRYEIAIVPHRSLRSAFLALATLAPIRLGFRTLHGRLFFTGTVSRRGDLHEAARNLSLLERLGIRDVPLRPPRVYPSGEDRAAVDKLLESWGIPASRPLAACAPGTVWNTKRWPEDRFGELAKILAGDGYEVALVGGTEDIALCDRIAAAVLPQRIYSAAGRLSLLQSAELIRRCAILVSNDSAPMHLGVAVGTPVVALFGATVPEFGFAPYGPTDRIVEIRNLPCRPCSSHGGERCPIGTFECMLGLSAERVAHSVRLIRESRDAS